MRLLLVLLLAQESLAAVARPVVRARPVAPAPIAASAPTLSMPQLTAISVTPLPAAGAPLEAPAVVGAAFDGLKVQAAAPGDVQGSLSAPEPLARPTMGPPSTPPPTPPAPKRPRKWKKWVLIAAATAGLLAGGAAWYLKPGAAPLQPAPPAVVIGQSAYELVPAPAGHKAAVVSVATQGGKRVTVDADGVWLVTDLATNRLYKPKTYPGKAAAVAFRGASLVLLDVDGTVRIDGRSVSPNAGKVDQHAFSPARDVVAMTNGSDLHLLDIASAQSRAFQMEGRILALAAGPGEVRLATLRGAMLRLWSVKPGAAPVVVREKLLPGVSVGVTVMSADGQRMAASGGLGNNKGVLMLEWGGKMGMAANGRFDKALEVRQLAVHEDRVAVLGADGKLWLWWPEDDEVEALGTLGAGARVVFGDDGVLYSSDSSGAVRAWASR